MLPHDFSSRIISEKNVQLSFINFTLAWKFSCGSVAVTLFILLFFKYIWLLFPNCHLVYPFNLFSTCIYLTFFPKQKNDKGHFLKPEKSGNDSEFIFLPGIFFNFLVKKKRIYSL